MRIKTSNKRRRNRQPSGRCPMCDDGILVQRKIFHTIYIGSEEASGHIRVKRCRSCSFEFINWRGTQDQNRIIERQTSYGLSPDGLRWRKAA